MPAITTVVGRQSDIALRIGNETAALAVLQSAWPARDCRAMARQSVFI